jgi:hypothetical protein
MKGGNRLDSVMHGNQEGSELSESLKVGLAVFIEFVGQVIKVRNAIFDDSNSLGIKSLRAIEEIHDASADHSVQCHQRPFELAFHLRPPLRLVGFPERQHGIPIHLADLQ